MEATGLLWCMGVSVLVQLYFADPVMCLRGMVRKSSQLTVELERTDVGSVLIAYAVRTKCLVHNCHCKFAGSARALSHEKTVLTHERFRLETNVLDVNALAHLASAIPAGGGIPTSFLLRLRDGLLGGVPSAGSTAIRPVTIFFIPRISKSTRLPLLPAQRCIVFFLPLSRSCFSMPSASRYFCLRAT